MKKSYVFLIVLSAAALLACNRAEEPAENVSGNATSDQKMPLLARENHCTSCHAIDKRIVGPAWMDVSRKYRNDPDAEARLIAKVSKGGVGVWGSMPMPANDAAGKKQQQITELVRFILGLAK